MFRLLLLFFLFQHTQGYGVKLQGKVEVGSDLAEIFQDMFDTYLLTKKNGEAEIDLSQLLKSVGTIASESKTKQVDTRAEKKEKRGKEEKKNKEKERKEEEQTIEDRTQIKKTFLEEIAGMQQNVHIYGKHKDDNNDKHLNNIKAK